MERTSEKTYTKDEMIAKVEKSVESYKATARYAIYRQQTALLGQCQIAIRALENFKKTL
jgi:hypothetical protein